jgi:hypothetical protein
VPGNNPSLLWVNFIDGHGAWFWDLAREARIFRISSNSLGSEILSKKNPKTLPWRSHVAVRCSVATYMLLLRRSIVCLPLAPSKHANMACSAAGHQQVKHEVTRLQRIAVLWCPVTALIVRIHLVHPRVPNNTAKRYVDAN